MTPAVTTLANGLRVVSYATPGAETAALGLYADTGSRFESANVNGIAHLFEHMVFKGTTTRSARAIAEQIEDVGGQLNAYTARDMTAFHARVLGDDVPLAFELIADLVRAPRFDDDDLAREKEVVLSELGEARDTPDDIVFDHLQEAAYPDQPLGRSILGSEETLAPIEAADLRGWLDAQFRGPSCVLAAAGKVDHETLVHMAEALLGDLPDGAQPGGERASYAGGIRHDRRKFEQTHLTFGYEAAAHRGADYYPLTLFATAAGGGMSSRLFQELREERGLAYSVYSTMTSYADTGLFSVYVAAANANAARAGALGIQVLGECAAGLDEAELARAKAQLKAGLLMSLEGCAGQAEYIARQMMIYGAPVPPSDVVARVDACTVDEVRAAAQRMLAGPVARAHVGA
ncbi:MAG: pitrilysin family protein, partial [Sphingomonadaceae bacterium]|nr:pitrilysin family protein [Sphingomonadaceae bacterium]